MARNENTLGNMGDRLFTLYAEKDEINGQLSLVQEQISALEGQILAELEKVNLDKITCTLGSISRTAELYPKIENFEELLHFADSEGYPGMIQKRVSSTAFKEYFSEHGMYPPGTDATTGYKINRRRAK